MSGNRIVWLGICDEVADRFFTDKNTWLFYLAVQRKRTKGTAFYQEELHIEMSMDFNALAQQFTEFYYNQFDSDRSQLGNLYRDESMLTFETSQLQGAKSIVEKLVSLPFQKVAHRITTLDAQPASPNGDVLVMITGDLLIDDEQNPQRFSQVFHLIPDGNSYYVFNDIFRLNYSA